MVPVAQNSTAHPLEAMGPAVCSKSSDDMDVSDVEETSDGDRSWVAGRRIVGSGPTSLTRPPAAADAASVAGDGAAPF